MRGASSLLGKSERHIRIARRSAEFAAAGYKVFGLSADAPEQQAAWKAQHGFSYPLLCDTDTTAALQPLGWVKDGGIVTKLRVADGKYSPLC